MLDSDPALKRSSIRRRAFTGNTASTQGVLVQASQGLAARRFPRGAFNVGLHKLGWFFVEGSCTDANADKTCWLFCPGPVKDSTPSSCRIGRSSNVCPETLVCQLPSCSCEIHTGAKIFTDFAALRLAHASTNALRPRTLEASRRPTRRTCHSSSCAAAVYS